MANDSTEYKQYQERARMLKKVKSIRFNVCFLLVLKELLLGDFLKQFYDQTNTICKSAYGLRILWLPFC
jgi:hypothetical protein